MDNHATRVEAVKQYAATHDLIRRSHTRDALGLTDAQIDNAIERLQKQGVLRSVSPGIYEFIDAIPKQESMDKRIWRAMKMARTFCPADIEKLSGAAYGTVQTRIRKYLADGYIKKYGKSRKHGNYGSNVYRVTVKGHESGELPEVRGYKPEPLINDTVILNRLICTRWAMRDAEAGERAIGLCETILSALKNLRVEGGE